MAEKPRPYLYHDRFFINPEGFGDGAICEMKIIGDWDVPGAAGDWNFLITDCNRRVNIHGTFMTKEHVDIALHKLTNIRDGLTKFIDFISNIKTS